MLTLRGDRVGHREVGPLVTGLLAAAGEGDEEDGGGEDDSCTSGETGVRRGYDACRGRGSGDLPTHERAFLLERSYQQPEHYPNPYPRGGVGRRQVGSRSRLAACRAPTAPAEHRPPGLPGLRLRGGPAPGGQTGVRGRPRRGVRRPAAAPPRGSRRPARARQRAGRDGRGAGRAARRGHVHGLRHRGRAPRVCSACTAAPAPRGHASCTPPSSTRRCCRPRHGRRSADPSRRRRPQRPDAARRPRPHRRRGRRLPVGQPRGRHGPARRRARRGGRTTYRSSSTRAPRPAGSPCPRVVGAGGVGAQVGRARRASASSSYAAARGGASPFPEDDRAGEHESGFENVPAILAAAAALQAVVAERDAENVADSTRWSTGSAAVVGDDRRTSRSWATRATGSPTWSRSPASTSTVRRW